LAALGWIIYKKMTPTNEQMSFRTLSIEVLEWFRNEILTGQLTPDTRIDQRAIALRLGVSLVPVREALRKLEAEGLIQIVPHRGAYVPRISRDEMEDIYALRLVIEGMATRYAVGRITADELGKMSQLIAEMETATAAQNYAKLLVLNREFHFTIYGASGRPSLCEIISHLWVRSERYRATYIHSSDRSKQALEEHKEILDAVRSSSTRKAVRALRNNVRQTMIGLLAAFDEIRKVKRGA
jgi:DNA-binding GntR family transcriptional regulator